MSDSIDNTKELDSYGVWVKTPPQDASQSADTQETQTDIDMPDFSDLDLTTQTDDLTKDNPSVSDDFSFDIPVSEESGLSDTDAESLKNEVEDPFADIQDFGITEETPAPQNDTESDAETEISTDDFLSDSSNGDSAEQSSDAETEISADDFLSDSSSGDSGEQELSLDDFMDGDFSDPNPAGAPESHGDDGEISLDDFFDDDSSKEKEDDISNDEALDIDLSFTEGEENEVPTVDNTDDISDSDTEESEEEAASEFDDMFESLGQESSSTPAETTAETEEVSMDDFGFSSEAEESAAAPTTSDTSDSEEVDLSDFGIDSDAEETAVHQDVQAAKKNQIVDYDLAISEDDTNAAAPTASEIESSDNSSNKEETVSVPENATVVDNSILEKIMTELSGLKSEINNLKSDFETLKNQETIPVQEEDSESAFTEEAVTNEGITDNAFDAVNPENEPAENSVSEQEIPEIPEPETSGFFSNDDQDETIALSGDELNNVMNSADFSEITSEEVEAPVEVQSEESLAEEQVFEEASAEENTEANIDDIPEPETSGFFSNDDQDETIALSGDELNNVMNSADFSELQSEEIASPSIEATSEETISSENATEDTPAAEDFNTDFTDENPFGEIDDFSAATESNGEIDSGLSMEMDNEILEEPDLSTIDNPDFESEISIPKVDDISENSEKSSEEEKIDSILVESSGDDLMDSVSESEIPEMPETPELSSEPAEELTETTDESESLDSLLDSSMTEETVTESTDDFAALDAVSDDKEVSETIEAAEEEIFEPEETVSEENIEPSEESSFEETAEPVEIDSEEIADADKPAENIETEIAGTVEADTGTFEELASDDTSIDSLLEPEADIATSLSEESVDYLNDGENFADSDAESITNEEKAENEGINIPELNEEKPAAVSSDKDNSVPADLKNDIRSVLLYMDQLLENLPEDKIVEFAKSEQFTTYKRLFNELGLS